MPPAAPLEDFDERTSGKAERSAVLKIFPGNFRGKEGDCLEKSEGKWMSFSEFYNRLLRAMRKSPHGRILVKLIELQHDKGDDPDKTLRGMREMTEEREIKVRQAGEG